MINDEWLLDVFDLMANENVRIEIKGEMGDVSAELSIKRGKRYMFRAHGTGETFVDAMSALMENYAVC